MKDVESCWLENDRSKRKRRKLSLLSELVSSKNFCRLFQTKRNKMKIGSLLGKTLSKASYTNKKIEIENLLSSIY